LLWFKLFKYVTITRPLMRMARVLSTCIPDILTYAFLVWVILIAFALLGYLFCGNEINTFSSIQLSILTILRSMYGDFDFDGLVEVSAVTGFIYLALWLITINIVLLNVFIAILSEAYRKVGEEERANPTDTTWSKILEEVHRRQDESESLRKEAINHYGKKRLKDQQENRPKGTIERLYGFVYGKTTGKKQEDSESEENEDDENHDDDIGDAVDAKTPTPAQKLAALDWTPWPTRVQPIESTTRSKTPGRASTANGSR